VHEVGLGRDIECRSLGAFVTKLQGRPSSDP
jgi:hypothetical protein